MQPLVRIRNVLALKKENPQLKVMVAMGGWNEGSERFSNVAASPTLRNTMVNSVIAFLQKYRFEGFSLDWEYPGMRGGSAADKKNHLILVSLLRSKFIPYGYLLAASVGVTEEVMVNAYDTFSIAQLMDYVFLMAYDLHGAWDGVAGHNAPLYASSKEDPKFAGLNQNAVVRNWKSNVVMTQRLVLGIPYYGRGFTLASSANTTLGAKILGNSAAGPYIREPGYLSYLEICEKLKEGGYTTVFDEEQKVPHSVKGTEWIGYDNPASVKLKAEYAKSQQMAGVMVWSIDTDDRVGVCGEGKFPLITTLWNELIGGIVE